MQLLQNNSGLQVYSKKNSKRKKIAIAKKLLLLYNLCMLTPYNLYRRFWAFVIFSIAFGLTNFTPNVTAKEIPRTPMSDIRQKEAEAIVDAWTAQGIFSTPVRANIQPINPDSEAASTMHETFFADGSCQIVVYVDPVHGTPTLPGLGALESHEYVLAFQTIVSHELSHCAHFARGLRYENPTWEPKYNDAMSVQMVMAQQMYNETRFVDAQMEHVADANAIVRMRLLHKDSPQVNTFLSKYYGLRDYWLNVATSISGSGVYVQHATQSALRWAMVVPLSETRSPLQWFDLSVQEASITALETAKKQAAWGGLGALLCATYSSKKEWASSASYALARIAANEVTFMPPAPWRGLPLDFKDALLNMDANQAIFVKTNAQHALQDLDALREFVTAKGLDPIPMEIDKIGRPEGVIPMDLAFGVATAHAPATIRQANGCVAVNPKD